MHRNFTNKHADHQCLVQLVVVADGQLHVARVDARLLVVAGGVAGKFKRMSADRRYSGAPAPMREP